MDGQREALTIHQSDYDSYIIRVDVVVALPTLHPLVRIA